MTMIKLFWMIVDYFKKLLFLWKKDIHEEITRLQSHIDLFVDCMLKVKMKKEKE